LSPLFYSEIISGKAAAAENNIARRCYFLPMYSLYAMAVVLYTKWASLE